MTDDDKKQCLDIFRAMVGLADLAESNGVPSTQLLLWMAMALTTKCTGNASERQGAALLAASATIASFEFNLVNIDRLAAAIVFAHFDARAKKTTPPACASCKFVPAPGIDPRSSVYHRAHRAAHLASHPALDAKERDSLDALVAMAERDEQRARESLS